MKFRLKSSRAVLSTFCFDVVELSQNSNEVIWLFYFINENTKMSCVLLIADLLSESVNRLLLRKYVKKFVTFWIFRLATWKVTLLHQQPSDNWYRILKKFLSDRYWEKRFFYNLSVRIEMLLWTRSLLTIIQLLAATVPLKICSSNYRNEIEGCASAGCQIKNFINNRVLNSC